MLVDGGDLPAMSLTAHARDEDRRHAMSLGFQEHLAKPVNVAKLLPKSEGAKPDQPAIVLRQAGSAVSRTLSATCPEALFAQPGDVLRWRIAKRPHVLTAELRRADVAHPLARLVGVDVLKEHQPACFL